MPIRIAVLDDHRLMREVMSELVSSEPGLEVVAAVGEVREVEPYLGEIDLLLLDFHLPGGGALELASRLHAAGRTRTIFVSMYQSVEYVRAALATGARGYVFKQSSERHLIDAIAHVMAGRTYVDPEFVDAIEAPGLVTSGKPVLSERERAVLIEIASGLTYKVIAGKLGIGVRTVETYRRRVAEKLGLRTRADFVRYVAELGWLDDVVTP